MWLLASLFSTEKSTTAFNFFTISQPTSNSKIKGNSMAKKKTKIEIKTLSFFSVQAYVWISILCLSSGPQQKESFTFSFFLQSEIMCDKLYKSTCRCASNRKIRNLSFFYFSVYISSDNWIERFFIATFRME